MIDFLAGAAVIIGGALALLAGIGLLRFPDVLARLHAAAKAATVGVIATTVAAALEVDTFGSAALLLLVTAFLFLSAPIGTSLLARAAYYDPDTERVRHDRDDLATDLVRSPDLIEERAGGTNLLAGWLAVVWVGLFASATAGVVLGAVIVGLLVSLALPGYRPRWPQGIMRLVAVMRFVGAFIASLWIANIDVARCVLTGSRLRPAVVRYPIRVSTRTELTLLMNVITFTPGSVAIESDAGALFIHVLDFRDEEAFFRDVRRLESRIIEAFGTAESRARNRVAGPELLG